MSKVSPLAYVPAEVPEDCIIRLSPSSIGMFTERPWQWYRQNVLGLDKFEYNTSSVFGTVVHNCAELLALDKKVDPQDIENYINSFEDKEDYCKDTVHKEWYAVAKTLVNGYTRGRPVVAAEMQVCMPLGDGVYVAGTCDLIEGTKEDATLTDYKTYNSKVAPKSFNLGYKLQLLTYALILRKQGINVTRIRNVYINRPIDGGISEKTGKPLKSYPPTITPLTHVIEPEDLEYAQSMLDLWKDTYLTGLKYPELLHIIYHDPRLKEI